MELLNQLSSSLTIPSRNGDGITGNLFNKNGKVIILSNMDNNKPGEWILLIDKLLKAGHTILTYTYNHYGNECIFDLLDVMNFVNKTIAKPFILVGASRGGVLSLKSAIESDFKESISAVIAISAPQIYEGELFYSDDDLKKINTPVFLINSEFDDAISDTKKMYEMIEAKKEILICSGNNHGTELLYTNGDILLKKIEKFVLNI